MTMEKMMILGRRCLIGSMQFHETVWLYYIDMHDEIL